MKKRYFSIILLVSLLLLTSCHSEIVYWINGLTETPDYFTEYYLDNAYDYSRDSGGDDYEGPEYTDSYSIDRMYYEYKWKDWSTISKKRGQELNLVGNNSIVSYYISKDLISAQAKYLDKYDVFPTNSRGIWAYKETLDAIKANNQEKKYRTGLMQRVTDIKQTAIPYQVCDYYLLFASRFFYDSNFKNTTFISFVDLILEEDANEAIVYQDDTIKTNNLRVMSKINADVSQKCCSANGYINGDSGWKIYVENGLEVIKDMFSFNHDIEDDIENYYDDIEACILSKEPFYDTNYWVTFDYSKIRQLFFK